MGDHSDLHVFVSIKHKEPNLTKFEKQAHRHTFRAGEIFQFDFNQSIQDSVQGNSPSEVYFQVISDNGCALKVTPQFTTKFLGSNQKGSLEPLSRQMASCKLIMGVEKMHRDEYHILVQDLHKYLIDNRRENGTYTQDFVQLNKQSVQNTTSF